MGKTNRLKASLRLGGCFQPVSNIFSFVSSGTLVTGDNVFSYIFAETRRLA